jgi:hypothetical protein
MKCDEISVLLVDDRARRTPEVAAHLRSCSECRAVLGMDAWARELGRLDAVPPLPAPDGWRDLRRGRGGRFALVLAGVMSVGALGAIALGGGWFGRTGPTPESETLHETARAASETEPIRVSEEDPHRENPSPREESLIEDLMVEAAAYVARDVTVRDVTYAPFGDLPRWVALPRNHSLEAPVFQRALYVLHPNPEVIR